MGWGNKVRQGHQVYKVCQVPNIYQVLKVPKVYKILCFFCLEDILLDEGFVLPERGVEWV